MAVVTRYPTRPLECWGRMKELRRRINRESWEARERGGVVVAGQLAPYPLLAGLGVFAKRLYGPYFRQAMRQPEVLVRYHEAADSQGFPRGEMCSSMHHYMGELLLGLTTTDPRTGGFSPVDFVFEVQFCHSAAKTAQLAGEILGVPHYVLDVPQEGGEQAVNYVASRLHDAVDWLEKVSGRKFQDELLVEAMRNFWEHAAIWARLCLLNQHIPAPLTHEMLHELMVPSMVGGHLKEVTEFNREVLAETEERVREGIAGAEVEAARLSYEGEPLYYADTFVSDIARRYGAVFVTGFVMLARGLWDISQDGRWTPVPRLHDLDLELKDRESALLLLARCFARHVPPFHRTKIQEKRWELLHRAQDWQCQGSVIHLDIGCRNHMSGILEAKQVLDQHGIATATFEASNGDPRDFSPQQVSDRMEAFLERLGLQRLS